MWGWLPGRKRCKQRPDRLESYTDRARLVVVLAEQEVRRLRHERLGTEHVLLGLLADGTGIASRAFAAVGVSLATARAKLEELVGPGQGAALGYLQLDPSAKRVLFAGARLQALRLGHHHVGDEHLLLCLLSQGDTAAVQVGFVDDSRDLAHIS